MLLLPTGPLEGQDRTSPGAGPLQVGLGAVVAYPVDDRAGESGGGVDLNISYPVAPLVGIYGGFYRMDVGTAAVDASDPELTGSRTHAATFHGNGSPIENTVSYATAGIEATDALLDLPALEKGRQEPRDPFTFAVYGGAGSYRGRNYAGASAVWFPMQQDHVSVFGTASNS